MPWKSALFVGKSPAASKEEAELGSSAQNHTKPPSIALFSARQVLEQATTQHMQEDRNLALNIFVKDA